MGYKILFVLLIVTFGHGVAHSNVEDKNLSTPTDALDGRGEEAAVETKASKVYTREVVHICEEGMTVNGIALVAGESYDSMWYDAQRVGEIGQFIEELRVSYWLAQGFMQERGIEELASGIRYLAVMNEEVEAIYVQLSDVVDIMKPIYQYSLQNYGVSRKATAEEVTSCGTFLATPAFSAVLMHSTSQRVDRVGAAGLVFDAEFSPHLDDFLKYAEKKGYRRSNP